MSGLPRVVACAWEATVRLGARGAAVLACGAREVTRVLVNVRWNQRFLCNGYRPCLAIRVLARSLASRLRNSQTAELFVPQTRPSEDETLAAQPADLAVEGSV